jgi:hypothetical protein
MNLKRYLPYVIVAIVALLWFKARDAQVRATALSDQRADSLNLVFSIMDSLQTVRDRERVAGEQEVSRLATALAASRATFSRLRVQGMAASADLTAHLDHDSTASDSLRGLVNTTITLFSDQAAACDAALLSCDSIQAAQRGIILGLDSSATERSEALVRLRELFEVERRRASPGILKRLTIAAPWMIGAVVLWEIAR